MLSVKAAISARDSHRLSIDAKRVQIAERALLHDLFTRIITTENGPVVVQESTLMFEEVQQRVRRFEKENNPGLANDRRAYDRAVIARYVDGCEAAGVSLSTDMTLQEPDLFVNRRMLHGTARLVRLSQCLARLALTTRSHNTASREHAQTMVERERLCQRVREHQSKFDLVKDLVRRFDNEADEPAPANRGGVVTRYTLRGTRANTVSTTIIGAATGLAAPCCCSDGFVTRMLQRMGVMMAEVSRSADMVSVIRRMTGGLSKASTRALKQLDMCEPTTALEVAPPATSGYTASSATRPRLHSSALREMMMVDAAESRWVRSRSTTTFMPSPAAPSFHGTPPAFPALPPSFRLNRSTSTVPSILRSPSVLSSMPSSINDSPMPAPSTEDPTPPPPHALQLPPSVFDPDGAEEVTYALPYVESELGVASRPASPLSAAVSPESLPGDESPFAASSTMSRHLHALKSRRFGLGTTSENDDVLELPSFDDLGGGAAASGTSPLSVAVSPTTSFPASPIARSEAPYGTFTAGLAQFPPHDHHQLVTMMGNTPPASPLGHPVSPTSPMPASPLQRIPPM